MPAKKATSSAKKSPKASQLSRSDAVPVWSTDAEQVQIEVVVTGEMYLVDIDIAKRMNFIQEELKYEVPIQLTGCSARDFERSLEICANNRECQKPPSKKPAHIINEMVPPSLALPSVSPEPKAVTPGARVARGFADMSLMADDDDKDHSYQPSGSDESASDSGEEYLDTDMAEVWTATIRVEWGELNAKGRELRLLGLEK